MSLFFLTNAYALKIELPSTQEEKLDKEYVKTIKQFCKALKDDGRANFLNEIAINNIDKKSSCSICNDFFQKIRVFCQVNKTLKKKATMQREPNLMVIYIANNLFNMLAKDKALIDSATRISMLLTYSITNNKSMTRGEQEYFEMLLPYIKSPFQESFEGLPSVAESLKGKDKVVLDDLFGD